MRVPSVLVSGLAAAWLLGPAQSSISGRVPAQDPAPQQPTFRSSAALVEVDVIVLDDKGKFVPGLTVEDITLKEDGRPQSIQQFYMITHDITAPVGGTITTAGATSEDRARRVFVVMFDEEHLAIDSLMRVKKGAEQFIREQMGPGDVGGVFVNGGMFKGRLTNDRAELQAGIRSAKPAFDIRQTLLAAFREWPKIPGEIDAARIEGGSRQLVDELGENACREEPQRCAAEGGLQQVENLIQQKAKFYVHSARNMTSHTVQNLQHVMGGLSRIPGRKTVVFLSEGFYVEESRSTLQLVAAQAARAGTAIYSIDGRGLTNGQSPNPDVTRASPGRSSAWDTGEDGPNILTSGTGGFMVHDVDDISRAFGLIAHDTSTYYVLGYAPENGAMDGKYRKIEVKTRADGLNVRARKGYLAMPLPPLLGLKGVGGGL